MTGSKVSSMEVKMPDGETLKTTVISSGAALETCLLDFWSNVRKNPPFIVGFDTEWMPSMPSQLPRARAKVALLKLSSLGAGNCNNNKSCILINLNCVKYSISDVLVDFLAVKDVKFVGINVSKDVEKLKDDYGLEVRNVVDLVGSIPVSRRLGGAVGYPDYQELPSWLVGDPASVGWGGCTCGSYGYEELQYATYSVYNSVKLAEELLGGTHEESEGPVQDPEWIIT